MKLSKKQSIIAWFIMTAFTTGMTVEGFICKENWVYQIFSLITVFFSLLALSESYFLSGYRKADESG